MFNHFVKMSQSMKMLAVVGNFKEQCNGLYVEKNQVYLEKEEWTIDLKMGDTSLNFNLYILILGHKKMLVTKKTM